MAHLPRSHSNVSIRSGQGPPQGSVATHRPQANSPSSSPVVGMSGPSSLRLKVQTTFPLPVSAFLMPFNPRVETIQNIKDGIAKRIQARLPPYDAGLDIRPETLKLELDGYEVDDLTGPEVFRDEDVVDASLRPPPFQRRDTTRSDRRPDGLDEPVGPEARVRQVGVSEAIRSGSHAPKASRSTSQAFDPRCLPSSIKARGKRRAEEEPLRTSRPPSLVAEEEVIMAEASRITDLMRSEIGVLDPRSMKEGRARGYVEDPGGRYTANRHPFPPTKRTRYYAADDETLAPPSRLYGGPASANELRSSFQRSMHVNGERRRERSSMHTDGSTMESAYQVDDDLSENTGARSRKAGRSLHGGLNAGNIDRQARHHPLRSGISSSHNDSLYRSFSPDHDSVSDSDYIKRVNRRLGRNQRDGNSRVDLNKVYPQQINPSAISLSGSSDNGSDSASAPSEQPTRTGNATHLPATMEGIAARASPPQLDMSQSWQASNEAATAGFNNEQTNSIAGVLAEASKNSSSEGPSSSSELSSESSIQEIDAFAPTRSRTARDIPPAKTSSSRHPHTFDAPSITPRPPTPPKGWVPPGDGSARTKKRNARRRELAKASANGGQAGEATSWNLDTQPTLQASANDSTTLIPANSDPVQKTPNTRGADYYQLPPGGGSLGFPSSSTSTWAQALSTFKTLSERLANPSHHDVSSESEDSDSDSSDSSSSSSSGSSIDSSTETSSSDKRTSDGKKDEERISSPLTPSDIGPDGLPSNLRFTKIDCAEWYNQQWEAEEQVLAEEQQERAADHHEQTPGEPEKEPQEDSSKQQEEATVDEWISGLDPVTQAQMEQWNLPTSFGQPISSIVDVAQLAENMVLDYGQEA